MDGIINSTDMSLNKLWVMVKDREAWCASVHRVGRDLVSKKQQPGFDPWVGKIPWRRKWQPTLVLLPGKFYGWRSLVGYSPWGCKQSDTTE